MKCWEIDQTFGNKEGMKLKEWGFGGKDEAEDDETLPDESEEEEEESFFWPPYDRERTRAHGGDLEKALERLEVEGSFLQTARYSMAQASNPGLDIDCIGLVGSPLSASEARAILGNNPGADAANSIAIPAEKVHFTNPQWDVWLQKRADSVFSELAGKKIKPVLKLKKLVLEGVDSHRLDECPGIATLVVLLPSSFQGGDMLFNHGIQSKTIRLAPEGHLLTSMVAAYSVVQRNHSPITSGYRLALHYEVHQPADEKLAIPALPDLDEAVLALRHAMVRWKEDTSGAQPKIVASFLQRKYPWEGFTLHALAGPDALLMAHLEHLAKELNFQLYIVQLKHSQIQFGYYEGPTDKIDRNQVEIHDFDEESQDGDVREQAFDMKSVPVYIWDFDFKGDDYLNGGLDDVSPHWDEYEIDDNHIRIDETYERTAFLLWPTNDNVDEPVRVRYSHEYASQAVGSCVTNSNFNAPSFREKLLVASLKLRCDTQDEKKHATRGLCTVAQLRKDEHMFLQILDEKGVASNLDLIGLEHCVSGYRTFGWTVLKDFFNDAVAKDGSNPRRQALLEELSEAASQNSDSEVVEWCAAQQERILKSLNRASVAEIDWLLKLATTRGTDFMLHTLYPQLKAQRLESNFWVHFVRRLQGHALSEDLSSDFSRECVVQAVENLFAHPQRGRAGDTWGYDKTASKKGGLIMEVLRLCVETETCQQFCAGIFEKMKNAADSKTLSSSAEAPAWECYAELVRSADEYLMHVGDSTEGVFRPFFRDAAIFMLAGSGPLNAWEKPRGCVFVEENLMTLGIAFRRAGGLSFLRERDLKIVLAGRTTDNLKTLIKYLIAELRPAPEDASNFTAVITNIVGQAIDVFDTASVRELDLTEKTSRSGIDEIMDLIKFCTEADARSEWGHLLARVQAPPPGIARARYTSRLLAPLLPLLRDYLTSQELDLDTDPFKGFSATVLKAFASAVMSQKAPNLVADVKIGCGLRCKDCDKLRSFFASEDQSVSFPRPLYAREHLSKEVKTPKSWGVTFENRNSVLYVKKPDNMTPAGLEAENVRRGKALLAVLGDETAQKRILGSDYEQVRAEIFRKGKAGAKRAAADDPGPQAKTKTKRARRS